MPAPSVKAWRTQFTTGSSVSVEPPSGLSSGAVPGWSNIPAWARLVPNIDSVSGLNWAHLTLWFRKTAA